MTVMPGRLPGLAGRSPAAIVAEAYPGASDAALRYTPTSSCRAPDPRSCLTCSWMSGWHFRDRPAYPIDNGFVVVDGKPVAHMITLLPQDYLGDLPGNTGIADLVKAGYVKVLPMP